MIDFCEVVPYRRLDAPDHGGLPPDVARRLIARGDRMRAEMLDPPDDVRALTGMADLTGSLAAVRSARAELDPGRRMAPGRLY